MNKQKGFTLIELIVVIAIIAVLAAIVLVNVTAYINKGKDAAIKGNLSSILTNAAVAYDTKGYYFNADPAYDFCTTDIVSSALDAIDAARGDTGKSDCNAVAQAWAACGALKDDSANAYCVDSSGNKTTMTTATCVTAWSATVCP